MSASEHLTGSENCSCRQFTEWKLVTLGFLVGVRPTPTGVQFALSLYTLCSNLTLMLVHCGDWDERLG